MSVHSSMFPSGPEEQTTTFVMPHKLREMQISIARRIREFDPGALLRLLNHLGYASEQIRHVGVYTTVSSRSLMEAIDFDDERERVHIHWNVGLLSSQSPLPSYFFKKIESGELDGPAFLTFLGYFDQILLQRYVASIYPEFNSELFPNWSLAVRRSLYLKNLKSPSALQWVCQSFFPELDVIVERIARDTQLRTRAMRLGEVALGDGAVFGQQATVSVESLQVCLFCEEAKHDNGLLWGNIIRERLTTWVFPVLAPLELDLKLVQVIQNSDGETNLSGGSYLGFDRMHGGEAEESRVVLYSGRVTAAAAKSE